MRFALCLFLVLLALPSRLDAATALSGEGAPIIPIATDADFARMVKQTVDGYTVPAYRELQSRARDLVAEVEGYCAAPSDETREELRGAFADMLRAWAGVDFFHFGPIAQDGRYERFAYWPDVHGTGARQLRRVLASGDAKLLEPGALASQSAAVQGLPALETLLFQGDSALLSEAAPDVFRCALSEAIAKNLETIATGAVAGWEGEKGWTALIENPGEDNPVYRTHAEAATEILKAVLTALEQMRDQSLLPAVGATPEDAKASLAPYSRSGDTMIYLRAGSAALQRLIDAFGFLDIMPDDQKGYASSVRFEFSNLDRALDGAGTDIEAALADPEGRSKLIYATIVLASLRDLVQKHIAVAVGLSPGFNSLDGD